MKKISILVPAYNEESSIPELYRDISESVSSLENTEWELWFVNDGSTDGTEVAILKLAEKDNRVHIISFVQEVSDET